MVLHKVGKIPRDKLTKSSPGFVNFLDKKEALTKKKSVKVSVASLSQGCRGLMTSWKEDHRDNNPKRELFTFKSISIN